MGKNISEMPFSAKPQQEELSYEHTVLTCIAGEAETEVPIELNDHNSFAISGLTTMFDEVCVDISGLHLNSGSISGLSCTRLKICNIEKSQPVQSYVDGRVVFMQGFAPSAFSNCSI